MASPSSSPPLVHIDPFVLEFAMNLKWLLSYATHLLDPTVEAHYPSFAADVAHMEGVLAHISFAGGCTLADVPFGALRLSREGVLYLLVCDHLLGGCPPTMHPFLLRAYGGNNESSRHTPSSSLSQKQRSRSAKDTIAATNARSPPRNADLNVSFPSGSSSNDEDIATDEAIGGNREQDLQELDAKPLGALDASDPQVSDTTAGMTAVREGTKETQAALILLRWLFAEGVLSEEELAATLNAEDCEANSIGAVRSGEGTSHASCNAELKAFRCHQRLAQRLTEVLPFYLGAHLLISRSILLQYCSTLLTVDGVMQHIAHLQAPLLALPDYIPYASLCPPSSVEGALLEWFQAVMDSFRLTSTGDLLARLACCPTLHAFAQYGPFSSDSLDPAERDFFRLAHSGECICIALVFYSPDAVPLAELSRALRDAEAYMNAEHGASSLLRDETELLQRHQSVCYWTAIDAAARYLGVWPLWTPEEVVSFGRTALPLHLFLFVQQLFAVLATVAEEDVRVSADTAWWEQMGNSDGFTELMEARRGGKCHTEEQGKRSGSHPTSLPAAQHVLRQSMRDSFPPTGLSSSTHQRNGDGWVALAEDEEVLLGSASRKDTGAESRERGGREPALSSKATTEAVRGLSHAAALQEATTVRLGSSSSGGELVRSVETVEGPIHARIAAANNAGSFSSSASSTRFSVEFAHTQRGVDDHNGSDEDGSDGGLETHSNTVETATSVLRPMVRRRGTGSTAATHPVSYSDTDPLTSVDALPILSTAAHQVLVGTYAVDTYTHTPDEAPLPLPQSTAALISARRRADDGGDVHFLGDAEVLLHARAVEHHLHEDGSKPASPPSDVHATSPQQKPARPAKLNVRGSSPTQSHVTVLSLAGPDAQANATATPSSSKPEESRGADKQSDWPFTDSKERSTSPPLRRVQSVIDGATALFASSLSYSSDFVVQSAQPPQRQHTSTLAPLAAEVADVAEADSGALQSASHSPSGSEPQVTTSPLAPLPPVAAATSAALQHAESIPESEAANAPVCSSTVAIKRFHLAAVEGSDAESASDSRDDDDAVVATSMVVVAQKKKPQQYTPRRVSSSSSSSLSPSSSSSSHSEFVEKRPVALETPHSRSASAHRPSSQLSSAAAAGRHPSTPDSSLPRTSAKDTLPPPSRASLSVTDIAVEDDGTSAPHGEHDAETDPFPTPTEREEVNHARALGLVQGSAEGYSSSKTSEDAVPSLLQTPVRRGTWLSAAQDPARLPSILSPSPVYPGQQQRRRTQPRVGDNTLDSPTHHTLTEGANTHGLSPLTPPLTQSMSEVFGSDYVALMEDVASSYVDLPQNRPQQQSHCDEESWFSSASQPRGQSLRSTGGSLMSVGSLRDTAPSARTARVRELLERLSSVNVAELQQQGKEELCAALLQQYEAVEELKRALQGRRTQVGTRSFAPTTRSGERKRKVQLRSPSDEHDACSASPETRRSSLSRMTVESRASPAHTIRSDLTGQLAETEVSSLLADILMPAVSRSPSRSPKKK